MERRNNAVAQATSVAERERAQRERRERLVRITSHEMRTPLSIATGYVDLLCAGTGDTKTREDLDVVRQELDRVSMATGRMLRLIRLHEDLPLEAIDMDELVTTVATRWHVLADRDWKVEVGLGVQQANEERVRACLDTLVENAVRYTESGDVIRLFACRANGVNVIGVADSGPGFSQAQLESINACGGDVDLTVPLVYDTRSQTGLGLSLVREVVESRGARLVAGPSREGGGEVRIVGFPARPRGERGSIRDTPATAFSTWWSAQVSPAPDRFAPTAQG
jgi:signal transduction histidine kinase